MKKIVICTAMITGICLLLSGCGGKDVNHTSDKNTTNAVKEKEVIKIDVEIKTEGESFSKSYSDSKKISEICDFIQELSWNDLQDEIPDEENGTEYVVTCTNEDNTTKAYYFKENNYFKTDACDWKIISNIHDFKQLIAD